MKNVKVNKIMYVGNCNKHYWHYQNFYTKFQKLSEKFIPFDYRMNNLFYGKDKMNKMFLELVEKEKPDLIFFILHHDEFYPETLLKIREISPKSLTANFFGDDDQNYECFTRYYALFFDYCFVGQKTFMKSYLKDGIKNIFFTTGTNIDELKPMNLEKKYDVTFIGAPKSNRFELIKYLINNGVDIKLFGRGWDDYKEFSNLYEGFLDKEELIKIINETKINLCFTMNPKGEPHLKGRVFEIGACKSFVLLEYFDGYKELFKENQEIVMFKDKEDLLSKIRYYLKYEDEREKIAEATYKKIKSKYNLSLELENFFKILGKKKIVHNHLPKINKKILELAKEDVFLPIEELNKKIKDYDYLCFNNGIIKKDSYKEYLQVYSLEKSKKDISCCNYYTINKNLGSYLLFQADITFEINGDDFSNLANLSQFAAKKEYFIKNLENFKSAFNGEKIDFITKENIVFIEIPLLEIGKIRNVKYKNMKSYFLLKFLYKLYSLSYQKKLFSDSYIYKFLLEILKGDFFLLWAIIDAYKNKEYRGKIKELED